MLETTSTAVKGVLQRARASLDHHRAAATAEVPSWGSPAERNLARRFADAFSRDDIKGVVDLLTQDAWLAMPSAPHQYHGHEAIAAFLEASRRWRAGRQFQLSPTRANTHPAFGSYLAAVDGSPASATGMIVFTTSSDRITRITRFLNPRLPVRFGLPSALE